MALMGGDVETVLYKAKVLALAHGHNGCISVASRLMGSGRKDWLRPLLTFESVSKVREYLI